MPRNSAGQYTPTAGNPVVTETTINSVWANLLVADLGSEVTNSLDRQGRGGMLAGLKLLDGSVGTPGLTFTNELSSGLYRISAGNFAFSVGGVSILRLAAALIEFLTPVQINGNLDISSVLTVDGDIVGGEDFLLTGNVDVGGSGVFDGTLTAAPATLDTHLPNYEQVINIFQQYIDVPIVTDELTAGACFSTDSDVTLPTGLAANTVYEIYNSGAVAIDIIEDTGVTIFYPGSTFEGNMILNPKGLAYVKRMAADTYMVCGPGVLLG